MDELIAATTEYPLIIQFNNISSMFTTFIFGNISYSADLGPRNHIDFSSLSQRSPPSLGLADHLSDWDTITHTRDSGDAISRPQVYHSTAVAEDYCVLCRNVKKVFSYIRREP